MTERSKSIRFRDLILAIVLLVMGGTGCEEPRTSGKGLYLPQGNIEDGKKAFVELGCIVCHTVFNTELQGMKEEPLYLELGGKVRRVKTYSELMTSIINPDHIISPEFLKTISTVEAGEMQFSPMPNFNEEMTVRQLLDLVAFLNSRYDKEIPEYIGYGIQYIQH